MTMDSFAKVSGCLKNVTVSQKCGKWYVSIQIEWETETSKPNGGEIGIDIGIVCFATLSNGEYFEPINAFKNLKGKLAKLQKRYYLLKDTIYYNNTCNYIFC